MKSFLYIFILVISHFCFGQNPYFQTIDKTNGLPSNSVYDIFQDSKGFMWFATGKGICRYDGSVFKAFSSDEQTSKSGSGIAEDSFGRIWYANFDGYLYYVENEQLKPLKQPTSLGFFKFGIIKDELFLIQPNAVLVYDLKTLKIKNKHHISDNFIKSCYSSKDKFYVLGNFLYEFSDENFKKHPLPNDLSDKFTSPILSSIGSQLIINSKSGGIFYSFEKGNFIKHQLNIPANFIQNTSVTDNSLWFCTPNGVFKSSPKENKTYFKEQNISCVFKDKHQNYWISTLNKGVLFVENFDSNYIELLPKPLTFFLGKNEIFIGTEKDLVYKLDYKTLKTEKIHETGNNQAVTQIFSDTVNDKLFFTSINFNILNKNFKADSQYSLAVKDVKKVDDKYFSFAASGISGIFYIDETLRSKWDFLFNKNNTEEFSGFNQSFLLKNINGKSTEYNPLNNTIYYATNNGLIAVSNDGKTSEIKYENKTVYLTKIQRFGDEIIGLSTNEKLYVIDNQNKISLFKLPAFIINEKFNRFFIREHYCYLFSANAVYEYDFVSKNIQKLMSLSNNLEATDVILKNNRLFFATSKGIVIKNRNETGNYPKPKLIINEILINGKRKEAEQLNKLNYAENDVDISFSTLSFIPNETYSVSYKINDSEWKILDGTTKNLKLSALSSGEYTIDLAINYNSQKIDEQKIKFKIEKPFWLTNVFLVLMSLVFLLVFYLFYKYQIRKIEQENQIILEKNELEKNLNLSKLKAIKSQMNPHFFYNALNTIQAFILSNEKKLAVNYLSKFSLLTRMILEMTEKETINVSEEIKTISLYLDIEKARFDSDFEYHISYDDELENENPKIPSMLLQPYIENAVKHGLLHKKGEKNLVVSFRKENENIVITIDDNGIGRKKSTELNAIKTQHKSFATDAMQKRIDILNLNKQNKITLEYIDKINNSGTTVVMKIPLE